MTAPHQYQVVVRKGRAVFHESSLYTGREFVQHLADQMKTEMPGMTVEVVNVTPFHRALNEGARQVTPAAAAQIGAAPAPCEVSNWPDEPGLPLISRSRISRSSGPLPPVIGSVVPKFMKAPALGGNFKPRVSVLTRNTLIGAAIFGTGWGISGQCPGSAVASIGTGNWPIIIGIAFMFLGAYLRGRFVSNGN